VRGVWEDSAWHIARVGCQCKLAYTIPITASQLNRVERAIGKTGESKRSFFSDAIEIHLKLHEAL
jgi:hypothetical protein